nr:TIR domain-containing adapter molecule 1 [Pogona vitticeps]
MAERANGPPSMEGIFGILAQIPRDKLVWYKHELAHRPHDRRICRLLRAMILLTLREEAEARESLDALGYDLVAAHIYRSHWGSSLASKANFAPPQPDPEVALAVARIYSLLAEEKLCQPPARDEAYRVAVRAFQMSGADTDQLKSLSDETQEKCGVGFTALLSGDHGGGSPSLPVGSHPGLIPSSLDPRSLRSTGTPLSFVSHFEISPATTMQCGTGSDRGPSAGTGAVGGNTSARLGSAGEGEAGLEPPAQHGSYMKDTKPENTSTGNFKSNPPCLPGPSHPQAARSAEGDAQRPMHGTEPPNAVATGPQAPNKGLPENLGNPSVPQSGLPNPARWSPASTDGPSAPIPKKGEAEPQDYPGSAPSPHPPGSSLGAPAGDESQFFSFVVLHAGEDEEVACRVKNELERLGVSDGATYSEDFLVPGHCPLGCFQNALDNSAFTLLLLTENFQSRLCAYQTSVALMDSFQRLCKRNTVIPFVPKENPIPLKEMPTLLAGLVAMDENSPVFRKRVQNTFTARAIQEKKAMWSTLRRAQEIRRQREREHEYQQMLRRLSELSPNERLRAPLGGFPGFQDPSGSPPPPAFAATPFPAPRMGQPPDHPSLTQPWMLSLGSGGPQPQFIIQNAQMIQIGDYNRMQADRIDPTLSTADEDGGED